MTTFWSCHLIVNRKLPDDGRHVRDFIFYRFFKVFLLLFLKWTQQTQTILPLFCSFWENFKYF